VKTKQPISIFGLKKYCANKNIIGGKNYEGIHKVGWYLFNSIFGWLVLCCT
jgi:hypothetical protein